MINVCLILNLKEGPALCCDLQWHAVPRIGDHVKLPTHAEYTFSVKSVEWTMHGAARVTLTPKADVKFKEDLKRGLDLHGRIHMQCLTTLTGGSTILRRAHPPPIEDDHGDLWQLIQRG